MRYSSRSSIDTPRQNTTQIIGGFRSDLEMKDFGAEGVSVRCLLSDSNYVKEPYDYTAYSAQYVFLFSIGYFIYDLRDMLIYGEAHNSKEYIVHHSLVLTAFSIILFTGKLFGFAMIALLVEVQTIFLHLRTMVRLTGSSKGGSAAYNALINANMACLFLFRHITVTYLLYVTLVKDEKTPLILLWHIEQATALQQLPSPHMGAAMTVTFLPTGRHLVSGGEDGVVACYRIPQAGMTSPGHVMQENDDMDYLHQNENEENEPVDMDEGHG
ncbi:unnamed protein product [Heligmosomoides polygyrus]|uniref:TLC domain-containing protein n=1 Tax=Heligmosomoides polygyrus TaxID=6339 RepID=A0A183G460_HELPZ|nr:unnamed protein product [Heligmosomoides polygyrus]